MCILCVIQKWSRHVATMLPWLVLPLIGLWALSQLFPPCFQFEVTSPRLACVFVLLVTLFWYEVLMPQLSLWRARRSAWLRERKRSEAIEMQKLRKMATRRCRNCLTPYRDQNPGGGKFMCSYCGHVSKRPVLDMPGPAAMGITNSGILGDLVGKGGKIWNGKAWSETGWICSHDWLENGNWVPGSFLGKTNFGNNAGRHCSWYDHCSAENSYLGVFVFFCRLISSFIQSIRWLWRKIFRADSGEDSSSESDHGMSKKVEDGVLQTRGEKARRKAEEKRQARLERELLEEEERKQREEVARLVDEQRRLRDAKMEAIKQYVKVSARDKDKDSKREVEKKRQERKREKDKGSNKSNSDCDELDRRIGKETERKSFDKRNDIGRKDIQKAGMGCIRTHNSETGHGTKVPNANSSNRGNGSRYLERVRGSFLSSSRAFNGGNIFGRGTRTSANTVSKTSKPSGWVEQAQSFSNKRDVHHNEHVTGIHGSNGDNKVTENRPNRTVLSEIQPLPTLKKSWHQLFTRAPSVTQQSSSNTICRSSSESHTEAQNPSFFSPTRQTHPLDGQIHLGLSSPMTPFLNSSRHCNSVSSSAAGPVFPLAREPPLGFSLEEPEIFEDPCYIPDPVALLGPVSESLDTFSLDLGTGFAKNMGSPWPVAVKNVPGSMEGNKCSPIESPISRLRVIEERRTNSSPYPCSPKTPDSLLNESSNALEPGTWQIWGTQPLGQDGLGFVGGPSSWLLPVGQNQTISQLVNEGEVHGTRSPQRVQIGNFPNGMPINAFGPSSTNSHPWLPRPIFSPSGAAENYYPSLSPRDISQNEVTTFGSSSRSSIPYEQSPANCWSKNHWDGVGSKEGVEDSTLTRPHIGDLFSNPDVQSVWSYN